MGQTGASVSMLLFLVIFVSQSFFHVEAATKRPATDSLSSSRSKSQRVMEPAFKNAGQEQGIEIWRVENFKPVPYPKKDYGKFYTGDSYVLLYTKITKSGKLWDIHFWLGKDTTQDEAGAAAIFAVQLDDQLGGTPVQYREVQDHESQAFLSHFKNGVRYLPGGVQSGFAHVDPNAFEKRLFQVKGARNVRVKQVNPSISSMNKGDCFILDVGKTIYVYVGVKSKRIEKLKAIGAANQIRDQDHAGKAKVITVDEYSPQSDFDEFFSALGSGSAADVPDETTGGDDKEFETTEARTVSLSKVSDASGSLKITPVSQKPLQQSALDTNDCFILDTAGANIFVWIGKKCNQKERSESMKIAEKFLKEKKYPIWTHIEKVNQGSEPTPFTQYFQTWQGYGELNHRLVRSASEEGVGTSAQLFHASINNNENEFRIEQIADFEQEDLFPDDIMLLDVGSKVYLWIGSGASVKEKSKADELAKSYVSKLPRKNVTIQKVVQGDEDDTFIKAFPAWNIAFWDNDEEYKIRKDKIAEQNKNL